MSIKLTANQMAEALSKKEISSVELTKAHLDQIEKVDGKVKAFLHIDQDGALAQAKAADELLATGKAAPLTGVPLALKDVFAQKGIPTTCGSKILQGWKPPYDVTLVTNLK